MGVFSQLRFPPCRWLLLVLNGHNLASTDTSSVTAAHTSLLSVTGQLRAYVNIPDKYEVCKLTLYVLVNELACTSHSMCAEIR